MKKDKLFAGANLIIEYLDRVSTNYERDVVVKTQYAGQLSKIIFYLMREEFWEDPNFYTHKYVVFAELGKTYNKLIEKNGDIYENLVDLILNYTSTKEHVYFAYGSNMNEEQMNERCPGSVLVCKGILKNHKFVLDSKGYASVIQDSTEDTEGLIWLITEKDEKNLDCYEGVASNCYRKEICDITVGKNNIKALVYISNRNTENIIYNPEYMKKVELAAKEHDVGINTENLKAYTLCDKK